MNTFLYWPHRATFIAERWLSSHHDCGRLTIIVRESARQSAERVKLKRPDVDEIFVLPDEIGRETEQVIRLRRRIKELDVTRVVLPFSMKSQPLQFVERTSWPDIGPHYPVFRQLWLAGFREFEVFNLCGTRVYYIENLLDQFVGIHRGERCFVVGNGPSLNDIDMTALKDEITFGSNRIYLGYEEWGFEFTYWGISDRLQIEEYEDEYLEHVPQQRTKFFPFEYQPYVRFENGCPVNHSYDTRGFPKFSDRCDIIHIGNTVTYMLIQLAAVMGCNPIILVGVDHRYNLKKVDAKSPSNHGAVSAERNEHVVMAEYEHARSSAAHMRSDLWMKSDATQPTHFHENYTSGKKRFVPPRPRRAEMAFKCANSWAVAKGVQILNATPGTALKAFPLVSYDSLFGSKLSRV